MGKPKRGTKSAIQPPYEADEHQNDRSSISYEGAWEGYPFTASSEGVGMRSLQAKYISDFILFFEIMHDLSIPLLHHLFVANINEIKNWTTWNITNLYLLDHYF